MSDQAQGLRRWAERHARATAPEQVLVVVGAASGLGDARATLRRWRADGHAWVAEPSRWQLLALAADSPRVPEMARHYPRWGLWLSTDPGACQRAYRLVRTLVQAGGPRRLLLLHGGAVAQCARVENLRAACAQFLGVELLIVAERHRDRVAGN